MEQLSIFNDVSLEEPRKEPKKGGGIDASEWALVYLVTYSGGNKGNLFVLKVEDARKLCCDECSHGRARGGRWMFQWTTLDHFAESGADKASNQVKDVHGKLTPFVFVVDTGKQDDDFNRLGIKKPTIDESREVLRSIGYELTYKSTKQRLIDEGLITEQEWAQTEKELYAKANMKGARA